MRFVWAVAAFVLAAAMIGAGIAQRTILQGPTTQTADLASAGSAPYLLVDGAVLTMLPGTQTLRAEKDGTVFAAYGRTADLRAWLADAEYTAVTLGEEGEVVASTVTPEIVEEPPPAEEASDEGASDEAVSEEEAPAEEAAAEEADADETTGGRSPVGSDLWLDEFVQEDILVTRLQLPESMSVIVASDGTAAAPSDVTVSWRIGNATPWAGPLIAGGSVLMVVGLFLYFLGIHHVRRSKGPRRKGLPISPTEPLDLVVEGEDKGVISAAPTRRALSDTRRRSLIAVPAVVLSTLLVAGCTADSWPRFGGTPTPTPTVIIPEGQQAPAVTRPQAERILARIADVAAEADAERDGELAGTRLEGAVLAERFTNYTLREAIEDFAAPAAIPTEPLEIVLPQMSDGWPRTFMALVDDTVERTASIMVLTQQDAWTPYKLSYLANLEAATVLPELPAVYLGAIQMPPDSSFLVMPPSQLATAYADIINNGEDSEYASYFDLAGDQFRASIAADRERRLSEFNETATETGSLTFSSGPGAFDPVALATLESGAIVAVSIVETDTVQPTNEDAVIRLENNATVRTLSGVDESATGFTTTFSDQLFFYVPGQGSSEPIRLLGYSSHILDAEVIS